MPEHTMTRWWSMTLRARLVLLIALAAVPILSHEVYDAWEYRELAAAEARENAQRLVQIAAADHERTLDAAQKLLMVAAGLPEVRRYDATGCEEMLADILGRFPRYVSLTAARPDGTVFCSGLPGRAGANVADRLDFQRARRTLTFAVGEFLAVDGKPVVSVSYPVIARRGALVAVMSASLGLDWIHHLATTVRLPGGAVLGVIDRAGRVLAHHPPAAPAVDQPIADTPVVRAIVARPAGGTIEGAARDRLPRLWAFQPLAGSPAPIGYVVVGLPKAAVYGPIDSTLRRNLLTIGLVSVLVLAGTWIGGEAFLVRPVRNLVAAIRRLAAGNLSERSGLPHRSGELGQLARAFDEMASALEQRDAALRRARDELEARIEERTLALWASQRQVTNVLASITDGFIAVDREWRFSYANPEAERLLGRRREELLGRELWEVFPEVRTTPFEREFRRAIEERVTVRFEEFYPPLDRRFSVHAYPSPDGLSIYFQDVTEHRRAEEVHQRLQAQLAHSEKLAAMGQLLAGVAHELNNPLSVVIGYSHLLHQSEADPGVAERTARIQAAAERCGRIIRNFLALARQRPTERAAVDLNGVVREAAELLAYQLRVDGIEVRFDLDPALPRLWADPTQLHQVVVNLLSNAHDALLEAGEPRWVTLTTRAEPAGGPVRLEIADTGPGIPAEVRARIFEPFFTTKAIGQGTGLGLSLCQGIVEAHGGTIGVESAPGAGAVFRIELPRQAPGTVRPAAAAPAVPTVSGRSILVVDDEADVATLLADMLGGDGHRVETAMNGAEALQKLRARPYDLIFCDIKMPVLDGPGLYREMVRRIPELGRRFVFVTGDALSVSTREFLETVNVPSLSKPFLLEDLRRVVREVAGR